MEGLLAVSQQEELVDLPNNYPLSTSDDEGESDGEGKYQKLLEAVSSLGGKNRWKLAERSEASLKVSEFNISSEGSGEKLFLSDLLGSAKMLPSLATVKKQLNRVKAKKILKTPLSKEETERILREVAFSKTSQTLSKWDPVVLQNRRAEQLVFPMEKELSALAPMEHVFSGWKARTPLEQDVFNLLRKNKQPVTDPLLTPLEKASLKAMSLEEAKIHRAELQKARVLQSYYEARARREKKIKSKKHHKVVKKGKAKKALKELEHLWKINPSAALEELGRAETARVMERMSLKHQGSGKWARSKSVMAKYDLEARQAMQEQLAKNKELTQKRQVMPQSEEEAINSEGESAILGKISDLEMKVDGLNPWMLRSCSPVTVVHTVPKQLPELEACMISEDKGAERPVAREDMLLKEFEKEGSLRKRFKPNHNIEAKDSNSQEVLTEQKVFQKLNKQNHWTRKPTVSSMGGLLQAQGENIVLEKEEHVLLQSLERVQTVDEVELDTDGCFQSKELAGEPLERDPHNQLGVSKGKKKKELMIDLQVLLTTNSPSVSSLAIPTIEELEDEVERDHRQIIKEAFAGDDVIREFLKEKREAVEANKPKDLDLILPGWGEWGGVGLKPSAKKRRHFLIKAPENAPRKGKNLPHVIFSEKVNIHAAAHQVRVLPHPFTHHQQFERTIQNPIGSTWNTQRTFQKLTIPNIDTKPGHVIKPIKAENVGYYFSSRSDLSVLQSNPKRRPEGQQKQQREKSCAD